MSESTRVTTLKELAEMKAKGMLTNAVIKATGSFQPPPLDLEAITERANQLPQGQTKADLFRLILEVKNKGK